MNIKITGQPVFWLTISLLTVEALRKLSKLHYDATCKAAAEPGGFLWGWKNMVEDEGKGEVSANFRRLDLSLKICEMADFRLTQLQASEIVLIQDYREAVLKALQRSNEIKWDQVEKCCHPECMEG